MRLRLGGWPQRTLSHHAIPDKRQTHSAPFGTHAAMSKNEKEWSIDYDEVYKQDERTTFWCNLCGGWLLLGGLPVPLICLPHHYCCSKKILRTMVYTQHVSSAVLMDPRTRHPQAHIPRPSASS